MPGRPPDDTRLVYTSGVGRVNEPPDDRPAGPPGDGIVRVSRTSAGRKGKTVTLVSGVPAGEAVALARELKRVCGSGGALKDGVIEIQGDHRAKVVAHLGVRYRIKWAGG